MFPISSALNQLAMMYTKNLAVLKLISFYKNSKGWSLRPAPAIDFLCPGIPIFH